MKIWRRGHIGTEHKKFLNAHNIKHEPWSAPRVGARVQGTDNYVFEMAEDDPAWPELKRRIGNEYTYVRTRFSEQEQLNAEWCIIWGSHSIESLRPEGYGWHQPYYANQCSKCGAGWRQVIPFRIKREPKLGKNQFSSFGSGFELFCRMLVFDWFACNGINGFETQPIILDRENRLAESLKQLIVTTIADPAIAEELVEHERYGQTDCLECGRTWHAHYVRGMLPLRRSALKLNTDFQLTNEWFGNGRTARREILVSQRVVRLIFENKWKGVELVPIQVA